jgi:hypothetical protein
MSAVLTSQKHCCMSVGSDKNAVICIVFVVYILGALEMVSVSSLWLLGMDDDHYELLDSCIWPNVVLLCIWQRNSIKFCTNLWKSVMETLAVSRQVFGKKVWAVHRKSKFAKTEKAEQVKSKVKSMLIIFFDLKGIDCSQRILPGRPNRFFTELLGQKLLLCHDNTLSHASWPWPWQIWYIYSWNV